MVKITKAKKRIALEITILVVVMVTLVLSLTIMKKPTERELKWVNPNEVSSSQLVEKPSLFNKHEIEFTGEAVTARMVRDNGDGGKGAWIHLNDDSYMYRSVGSGGSLSGYNSGVAVWVHDVALTDAIKNFGGYKTNGDVVKIVGVFNAACSMHGGDIDVHATSVQVVSKGLDTVRVVPKWKVAVAIIFVLLAVMMFAIDHRRTLREKFGQWRPLNERD